MSDHGGINEQQVSHQAVGDSLMILESQQKILDKLTHWRALCDQGAITHSIVNHTYDGHGTIESPYLVDWIPNDPRNPFNFSNRMKWLMICIQSGATLVVSFASSAPSGCMTEIGTEFHASVEIAILSISVFVLGFSVGPLIFAPLSELYGRQKVFFIGYLFLAIFNVVAATAPTMACFLTSRFLAGSFGSAPLPNVGGVIVDMFSYSERGIATSVFAIAPFLGPALGPIVGGFFGDSAGWRWVVGLTAILSGATWIVSTILYTETYSPVLLRRRASTLTKATGKVYVSRLEANGSANSISSKLSLSLYRPLLLLVKEPVVFLISIYMAIIYGTLYMCFAAFPIVYQERRGWSNGTGGLTFMGIATGMIVAVLGTLLDNKRYERLVQASPDGLVSPEARLPSAILGSVLLPVGLFTFAWTNGTSVHWMISIVGSGIFAAGIALVFLSLINYILDSYAIFAASALAANTLFRSVFGCVFPLFTPYMYRGLGIHWASSVPAFMALACMPFPALLYLNGSTIRSKCYFAAEASRLLMDSRTQQTQERGNAQLVGGPVVPGR